MRDGMARALDVMHDISDGIRQLTELLQAPTPTEQSQDVSESLLLSVKGLAALVGTSEASLYSLRSTGKGPPVTRVGSRVYFQRVDVDAWLREQREYPETTRPWRDAFLPGRIGFTVPRSSVRGRHEYCAGSHTEPLAASKYSGRAVCRSCRDDVLVNRDGLLRKHDPKSW